MVRDGKSISGSSGHCPAGAAKRLARVARALVLLPLPVLVAACGMAMQGGQMTASTTAPPPPPSAAAPPPMAVPVAPEVLQPTPGLAARERFQLAINLLQQGDAPHAEVELEAYLAEIPNSVPARNLLVQIETPLEMLYPAESFTVMLGPNETLSTLSGIYLGDVLAFYGLARYNNISNPSRVSLGQAIKIPSTPVTLAAQTMRTSMMMTMPMGAMEPTMPMAEAPPPRQQASVTPQAPPRPADPWVSIRGDVAAGRYEAAIRTAETARVSPDRSQAAVLAQAYAGNAKAVRAANATEAGAQALRAGQLYLDPAGRPEEAIDPLMLAVEIDPADMQAQTLLGLAKTRAADAYYRNGLVAFQRQDLDGAIAAWDKALSIDPGHRNAQLNRAQALELKQNLQRLR